MHDVVVGSHWTRKLAQAGVVVSALLLAACDSSEERAQGHLERALALIEEGDPVSAELEFRNALQLNGQLHVAHLHLGELRLDAGNIQSAVGHYLRVIELDETNLEARLQLGQIMLGAGQLDEALRHAQGAARVAPDNVEVLSLRAGIAFGLENFDNAAALADQAIRIDPAASGARMVKASLALQRDDDAEALAEIDRALEANPEDPLLSLFKIRLLEEAGRDDQIGAVLENLTRQEPTEKSYREALARWHLRRGDAPAAERVLRDYAAALPNDVGAALSVVQFLGARQSAAAAIAELEILIDSAETDAARFPFEMALAEIELEIDQRDKAAERIRRLIATHGASTEGNAARVLLSRLLLSQDDRDGARAEVATVLEDDPRNADALAIRAGLHLRESRYDEAVQDIRLALAEAPDNWRYMLLEAQAHKLNGSASLAGERLAAAVEASDYGAQAVVAYARHLIDERKTDFAASLIEDGLARSPNSIPLLNLLARLRLAQSDWLAAEEIARRLETLESGKASASEVMARVLAGDDRGESGIASLEQMVRARTAPISSLAALISSYVRAERYDDALAFLDQVLDGNPENPAALMLKGDVQARLSDLDAAEQSYRAAVEAAPTQSETHRGLVSFLFRNDRNPDAIAAARAGLEHTPNSAPLRLTLALLLEQMGEDEAAVAEYERLHISTPDSFIVANNLASLLIEKDQSPEQIERAFGIAKRLRSARLPHYQNTYGWLLFLRGEPAQAARYLKPAADALPGVMVAHLHLGLVYADMGLTEEARAALTRAVELGDKADPADLAKAKEALASLPTSN